MPRYRRRYYDDYSYPPRRRGCFSALRRLVLRVVSVLLFLLGTIILVVLALLIAQHLAQFLLILTYALYVAAGLAVLGLLYVIVRIVTAISHRLSAASVARSKARQEKVQVKMQQVRLAREAAAIDHAPFPGRTRTSLHRGDPASFSDRQHRLPERQGFEVPNDVQPSSQVIPMRMDTQVETIPGMPARGHIFRYRDYQHLLQPGQLMLGIRQDGTARVGTWQDLKVLLILGSSASGKTTTLVEKCLCAAVLGGYLVVCDPHAAKPDSLTRRIAPLHWALLPGTAFAVEHDAILANAKRVREELERRRRGGDTSTPIFLVVEELNRLMRDKEIAHALQEILQTIGQEGRGFNVFAIVAAQQITGLAEIRKSILSVICHKVSESEARRCIPARFAKYSNELGVGQTFVMDADGITEPLQQVLVTVQDCQAASRPAVPPPPASFYSDPTQPLAPSAASPRHMAHQEPTRSSASASPSQRRPGRVSSSPATQRHVARPASQPTASAVWGEPEQDAFDTILVSEAEVARLLASAHSPQSASSTRRQTEPLIPPKEAAPPGSPRVTVSPAPQQVAQQKLEALARLRKAKRKA